MIPGCVDPPGAPPPTGPDESPIAALVQRGAAADPAAFNQLYSLTCATVFRAAVAVLRDPSQAEEVTEEVFAEIWRSADRFDASKGSAASWIRRLAHSAP